MNITERIVSTVVGSLIVTIVTYSAVHLWRRIRRGNALIRLRFPQIEPPRGTSLVLRHIRDGKDEISDKSNLINKDQCFLRNPTTDEWLIRITYQKNLGFQFKCYVEYPDNTKDEVLQFLGTNGFIEVSEENSTPPRFWFLFPKIPTCETSDHYRNNYFHPGLREIVHQA